MAVLWGVCAFATTMVYAWQSLGLFIDADAYGWNKDDARLALFSIAAVLTSWALWPITGAYAVYRILSPIIKTAFPRREKKGKK